MTTKKFQLLSITLLCLWTGVATGQTNPNATAAIHKVLLQEVVHTTKYSYLRVVEGTASQWLAVPSVTFTIGDTLYYQGGMLMTDFKSKELNRTFDNVLFLEIVSKTPEGTKRQPRTTPEHTGTPVQSKLDITVTPAPGGITIGELFRNKDQYSGKRVKIRAQVVKFKSGIMNKNWMHLQDGTAFKEKFDLTATTDATVAVGDTITVESEVTLDKDFGSGYFFELILENATVL